MKRTSRFTFAFFARRLRSSRLPLSVAMLCACVGVAGSFGAFACWPLAPTGGTIGEGGIVSPGGEGGPSDDAGAFDGAPEDDATNGGGEASAPADGSATDGPAPVLPQPSTTIAQGIGFACAIGLVADAGAGTVSCWGNNGFGQAGAPVTGPMAQTFVAHPNLVAGITNAIAIALGDYHACAVTATNAVYCWGLDNAGQLGHSDDAGISGATDSICAGAVAQQTVGCNPTPTLASVPAAVRISAAGASTCIVGVDKTVTCWGAVQDGATVAGAVGCGLGIARTGGMCYPAPYAPGVTGASQLAVGFDHACAVVAGDAGNVAACWGNNSEGQVWPSCAFGCEADIELPSLPATTSIGAGRYFTCALITDGGTVSCFGDDQYGELGQPPPANPVGAFNTTPAPVGGLGSVSELVVAGNEAACALVDGGSVTCWGNVALAPQPGVPVVIPGLPPLTSLGVPDDSYACGVAGDGGVWCWYLADGGAGPDSGGPTFVQ